MYLATWIAGDRFNSTVSNNNTISLSHLTVSNNTASGICFAMLCFQQFNPHIVFILVQPRGEGWGGMHWRNLK